MAEVTGWKKWLWPLRSRKVQVAVATVIASYASEVFNLKIAEDQVTYVIGIGAALILGIAIEDAGAKANPNN